MFRLLTGANCTALFLVNSSGVVSVRQNIDRESIVEATGGDILSCFYNFKRVTIQILDVNDEVPHFSGLPQTKFVSIQENSAIDTNVILLQPIDEDNGCNGTTEFNITSGNEDGYFILNRTNLDDPSTDSSVNRRLYLHRDLDYDSLSNPVFNLTITLRDMGNEPLIYQQFIIINVTNIDDEPPTFDITSYTFLILRSQAEQEVFGRVRAETELSTTQLAYSICPNCFKSPTNVVDIVRINETTGELYLNESVEGLSQMRFTAVARHMLTGARETTMVTIDIVDDVNQEPPHFVCAFPEEIAIYNCTKDVNVNNSVMYIEENLDLAYPRYLITLEIKDNDGGEVDIDEVDFATEPPTELIHIDPQDSGGGFLFVIINVTGSFDRELLPSIRVILTAENSNALPPLRRDTFLTIVVLDHNDNAPVFTEEQYTGHVSEGSPVGTEVVTVRATDSDARENGTVVYSISNVQPEIARDWFQISEDEGLIMVQSSSVDYVSVGGSVTITVTASDRGHDPMRTHTTVLIRIIPSTTFISGSYQEYPNANLFAEDFYMEFMTTERNGLLAYQQDSSNRLFSVRLEDGHVSVQSGSHSWQGLDTEISEDKWYLIRIQQSQNMVIIVIALNR